MGGSQLGVKNTPDQRERMKEPSIYSGHGGIPRDGTSTRQVDNQLTLKRP